ncbi:S26 family signal peptidase [Actinoplanes sichuanensis]|uniref:S26 family signal peptidase n=1 Tax=Actinoplanes sichuanensis TaxID=512349 RepID=A0ABW4A6H1_9ACTN|nr:S26 family signal peptidase [Actinoplanes sichuanensis]BEL07886.1 S26 family signal peptidase [Actinoplanes sichuanensis]
MTGWMLLIGVLGTAGLLGATVLVQRRRLVLVTVRGASMLPTLRDGDRVLVRRLSGAQVRPGQIVVLEHPDSDDGGYRATAAAGVRDRRIWMIKRCTAVAGDPIPPGLPGRCHTPDGRVPAGVLTVLSDNPTHPNDSRRFGFLPYERVLGVARVRNAASAPYRRSADVRPR